jgi:hypothetical protein
MYVRISQQRAELPVEASLQLFYIQKIELEIAHIAKKRLLSYCTFLQRTRVSECILLIGAARWFIFIPKIPIWVNLVLDLSADLTVLLLLLTPNRLELDRS